MPGYIIHLTEAKLIEEHIFHNNFVSENDRTNWTEQFEYGSLIPDAIVKEAKRITHFWREEDKKCIVQVPHLELFRKKYSPQVSQPFCYGYFAHLYLDFMFFQKFLPQYATFLDERGREEREKSKIREVFIHKTKKEVDLKEFFSEEYLYGDYTKSNYYFMEKYHLKIPKKQFEENPLVEEARNCDYRMIESKLGRYLKEKRANSQALRVFTLEELEQFLRDTAKCFLWREKDEW